MANYEVYFSDGGVGTSGLSVTWEFLYQRDGGGAIPVSAQPSFTDLAGGWYTFDFSPTETLLGIIDGSSALGDTDRYVPCKFTVNDQAVKESRLVELDAANIPTDIDFIYADVSGLNGEAMRGTDGAITDISTLATSAILDTVNTTINAINNSTSALTFSGSNVNAFIADKSNFNDITVAQILAGDIDGITLEVALEKILAYAIGKIDVSGLILTYYLQDNTTSAFALSSSDISRTRS